jgi:hypothetical protein
MTQDRLVTLSLPAHTLAEIGRAARCSGCSPTDYVRAAIEAALRPVRGQPDGIFAVRALFDEATSWLELQRHLRHVGYVMRQDDDGSVHLHSWPANQRVLPIGDIGYDLAALVLRFRAPFPGDTGRRPAVPPHTQGRAA